MIEVSQFTILTTNQCTATCGHCSMNSSPQRTGKLSFEVISETIESLIENNNRLDTVIFAGGEPTLLRSDLLDAIAFCADKGLNTRLVTNASWAITEKLAERMVTSFREAGLAEINYSVDDFHQPDIDFSCIVNAWRASKNKGFDSVVIANCYGPKSHITSDFIRTQLAEDLPAFWDGDGGQNATVMPSEDGTRYLLSNSRLQRLGRGSDLPDGAIIFPEEKVLNLPCPWAVRSAALSAGGHLVACCGTEAHGNEFLDFGDVREFGVGDLLEKANESLVIKVIRKYGPYFLMNFIKSYAGDEKIFKDRYSSVCEICEGIVHNPRAREIAKEYLPEISPIL
ncbi:radical SAM protein [Burkholderia cepacia]|uniref:radical SAM protein n=1 Tax=Burkholderia cepacia TaxID=292 RepID=UPI002FDFB726